MWAEAALYATHVYNRLSNASNEIPLAKFTSLDYNIDLFKSFGGLCWFRDNDSMSNLSPQYKEGSFIIYIDSTDTSYKIWDIKSDKAVLIRDVVFSKQPINPLPNVSIDDKPRNENVVTVNTLDKQSTVQDTTLLIELPFMS
jgi:WD40 repeat protein